MPTPAALHRHQETPLDRKPVWSLDDAASATTLSKRKLQELIALGQIPAAKIGRRVLLNPDAVRAALFGPR